MLKVSGMKREGCGVKSSTLVTKVENGKSRENQGKAKSRRRGKGRSVGEVQRTVSRCGSMEE
jgi:hypothetical protein